MARRKGKKCRYMHAYLENAVNLVISIPYRFLHSISYRQFTRMVHGILHDKRIPLPACAYHAIRTAFKVADETFEGYDDNDV